MRAAAAALVLLLPLAVACGAARPAHGVGARTAQGGDWTRFGYSVSRQNAGPAATGITAANVRKLRRHEVSLDGTVDSSPIYLRGALVRGGAHDVFVVTTTYGKTLAIDASSGAVLWRFTPPGYSSLAGSQQITTATPAADPSRRFVYAATPDGRIRKLSLATGKQVWAVAVTRDPTHEKIAGSLNLYRGRVLAATGGYVGDAPPYQGHVVTIAAATGRIVHVWNSLCSDRHALIVPSSCQTSDSAIWGRSGVVVDPATSRLLVTTGNAPWDGKTNWGDSVLALSLDAGRLLGNWTPANQEELNRNDTDLGSTAPALVGGGLAVQGGKDGKLRVLNVRRLNGTASAGPRTGGELQTVGAPGGQLMFTAPAVWKSGGRTWVFVGSGGGTWGYAFRGGRLRVAWKDSHAGTSPVVAGGLLYVYDAVGGALDVYRPATGALLVRLPTGTGHWNSPIVTDGRVAVPEGNANEHKTSGILAVYRLG